MGELSVKKLGRWWSVDIVPTGAIVFIAGLICPACLAGVNSATYVGTVTVGHRAAHSFDDRENSSGAEPVVGAMVSVLAVGPEETCAAHVDRGNRPDESAVTGSHGEYEVSRFYTGGFGIDPKLLVCVTHPDYKPYEYSATVGESTDPRNGEKFLNIQMETK